MSKHDLDSRVPKILGDEQYRKNILELIEPTSADEVRFRPSTPIDEGRPKFSPPTLPDRMGNLVITDVFGQRKDGPHEGIDLRARAMDNNTDIMSVMDGTVAFIKKNPSGASGVSIHVTHEDGTQTRYFHGKSIPSHLREGDKVLAGDVIMEAGNTGNSMGPHLHFEHGKLTGDRFQPMNPLESLPQIFNEYMLDDEADSLMLETRL